MLTDESLWTLITDLMPGWPFIVYEFDELMAKGFRKKGDYPKPEGLLLQVATYGDDREMFDRLAAAQVPLLPRPPEAPGDELMRCAVCAQHIRPSQWTFETLSLNPNWVCEPNLMRLAVKRTNVRLMSWLHKHCPPTSVELTTAKIDKQAWFDHLAVVKCLFHRKYKFSEWALTESASRDELTVVQFL